MLRALFSLRNLGTEESVAAVAEGLEGCKDNALLRHEVAYVLGQIQSRFDGVEQGIIQSRPREPF